MSRYSPFIAVLSLLAGTLPGQLVVNTVAGGRIQSGIAAQDAVVGTVGGITQDPSGNLVFSELSRYVIRRIRTDGTIETIAGTGLSGYGEDGGPATSAPLTAPGALQYDSAGNLYFVDKARIRRIDTSGTITTVLGTGIFGSLGTDSPAIAAQIGSIFSLAFDQRGNLYFSESVSPGSGRIRRLTTDGHVELFAGIDSPYEYCSCGDGGPASAAAFTGFGMFLAFDRTGNLYVSDENNLRRISPDGTIDKFAAYNYTVPNYGGQIGGLTIDSYNALYLTEYGIVPGSASFIIRLAADGTGTTVAGGGKGGDGPAAQAFLNNVSGLEADGSGNVFFTDHNRIRELTAQGFIKTIAGGAPKSAPDGVVATDTWLANPSAIAVSPDGKLYIFEQATCLIRKVGTDGRLSTVAGTGRCTTAIPNGPAASTDLPQTAHLAVDSQHRIYGAGAGAANFVYVMSPEGTVAPQPGATGIPSPLIAVDSKDRLYVAGFLSSGLRRIALGGATESLTWLSSLPVAEIGIDALDNIYAAAGGPSGGAAIRVDQSGKPTPLGTVDFFLQVNPLASITGDAANNAWYTDGLFMWKITGTTQETFGQVQGFSGDGGPAMAAFFSNPSSLAFAPGGDLYVLDQGNNRVRKIGGTPPGKPPAIDQGGVVSTASLVGGPVAPGELIAIFGANFGPTTLVTSALRDNFFPTVLGSTRVFFNGAPGAIVAATANQINAFVPYGVTGTSVNIVVDVDGVQSAPASVPVAASAISFFSANGSGTGQGAILNQDGSVNGSTNPAVRGSIISVFGTGEGIISPALPDGALVLSTPLSKPVASPVTATMGSEPVEVVYAGSAPLLSAGVFQLNVRIPIGVSTGDVPISVTVGASTTARQITAAVR